MEEKLFDWPKVHELAARDVEITKETDDSNQSGSADDRKGIEVKSRSIHSVVGGASDKGETSKESSVELEPPERYRYGHPLSDLADNRAEIGGGRFRHKTHATTLFADRGLPVRHLAAIVQHVEYGHPEPDEGFVALLTRRSGGETRHGWHLISGVDAEEPGATLRVTPAGYEIEVGGEALEPVEGCPPDGPAVCLTRSTKKVEAALSRHDEGYGAGDDDDETLETLIEDFRVEALDEALSKASEQAGGAHPDRLQIVVDGRVPQAVITRVISAALFETKTSGERTRVVGGRFGEFFLAAE